MEASELNEIRSLRVTAESYQGSLSEELIKNLEVKIDSVLKKYLN
jgi:hypothetical protein